MNVQPSPILLPFEVSLGGGRLRGDTWGRRLGETSGGDISALKRTFVSVSGVSLSVFAECTSVGVFPGSLSKGVWEPSATPVPGSP